MKQILQVTVTACLLFGAANAQSRRASIVGGGNPNEGKCTIEVVVDGAAEVEIRGDRATLRNLNGQHPQWRRFECSSRMPLNPANFRFEGIDGRGRQDLVANPASGGPAVIRIEDRDGGSEGYTFDVMWAGSGPGAPYGSADRYDPNSANRGVFGDYSDNNRAIAACQDAVRQEGSRRFGIRTMDFRRERVEDDPGNRDTVRGRFFAMDNYNQEQVYRYTCTVNTRNGRVRNVTIDPAGERGKSGSLNDGGLLGGYRDTAASGRTAEVVSCQQAAENRIIRDGYSNVSFGNSSVNSRAGRVDGTARASGRRGVEEFDFSCGVDTYGSVRSVDVRRR